MADPPTVQVEVEQAPITFDRTRTMEQLTRMPGRSPGPVGLARSRVLGLAHARYGERSQIRVVFQEQPDRTVCGTPTTLSVTFGFQERRVFIARELPAGTCIHREVLAHELKHVEEDERLLRDFVDVLRRRLEATVRGIGIVRGRTQDAVMTTIRRPVDATLHALLREFTQMRDRRQAGIDTAEEYRRVTESCDGELARFVPHRAKQQPGL